MSLFSRFKTVLKQRPEEQIVGYSISELKAVFDKPLTDFMTTYPQAASLENSGIPAYYSSFLIDNEDAGIFWALVESNFSYETEKRFNHLPVQQYANNPKNQHLVCFTSNDAFNSTTVRLVTNSVDFLDIIHRERFAVPPPWIAFEGYNPSWWGGNMQGANGYYNDSYFLPFFTGLNKAQKNAYFTKYGATDAWIDSLELMYGGE
ncbi:hypothetical protein [Pseudomonas sp. NPDC096950]|uniref:hypothetical protein n=1 Tax=Pseudomonas sp. NPDC096950 TaxID=3364485 RepID=UPI00383A1629